ILARHGFVSRLKRLEQEFGMTLPKGASAAVDIAAKEFVARYGAEKLAAVSKLHFRTASRAQGLPEPPRPQVPFRKIRVPGVDIDPKMQLFGPEWRSTDFG